MAALRSPDHVALSRYIAAFFSLWLIGSTAAQDVVLRSPLITRVPLLGELPSATDGAVIQATITVPQQAPKDLGIGAFATDRHGSWFQVLDPQPLTPGTRTVRLRLSPGACGGDHPPTPAALADAHHGGLFLWATTPSNATITITDFTAEPLAAAAASLTLALTAIVLDGPAHTGVRWEMHSLPRPLPTDPYDPALCAIDLIIRDPKGNDQRIPGFWEVPYRSHDGGDRELLTPEEAPRFTVRWRPRLPGIHHLRLECTSAGKRTAVELPDQEVSGKPWDDYVRVDPNDPRFLQTGGVFYWPIGVNLRSVTDSRATEDLGSKPTPTRGTLAYDTYLTRFSEGGATAAEVWLSSWNFALEWRKEWPGYHGIGRYHDGHAWQLDRLLDLASAKGMRLLLAIHNHGQASVECDKEWNDNPYSTANGGPCASATEFFTNPAALAYQHRLDRYLAARYADHPAVLGWKLFTEMDLTEAGQAHGTAALASWHAQATASMRAVDTYGHPITSHWSTNYRQVFAEVVETGGLDFLTIDAYHGPDAPLAQLLWSSTKHLGNGRFHKGVIATEYGMSWDAGPEPMVAADHAAGAWMALVSGHAGAPMLWWFEWVDQGARFAPYRAIGRFIAGEDLRLKDAQSMPLHCPDTQDDLWAAAWSRQGRLLGYVVDQIWQRSGQEAKLREHVSIRIANTAEAGAMAVQWWNADSGEAGAIQRFRHPGGALDLIAPAFLRHLAWKLWRE